MHSLPIGKAGSCHGGRRPTSNCRMPGALPGRTATGSMGIGGGAGPMTAGTQLPAVPGSMPGPTRPAGIIGLAAMPKGGGAPGGNSPAGSIGGAGIGGVPPTAKRSAKEARGSLGGLAAASLWARAPGQGQAPPGPTGTASTSTCVPVRVGQGDTGREPARPGNALRMRCDRATSAAATASFWAACSRTSCGISRTSQTLMQGRWPFSALAKSAAVLSTPSSSKMAWQS
mmetsp:Transcript_51958/g.150957  ORF Transcript_51958/g.150957 Transcript_51958/m.150957 type:complete len:229 (-) Transcript_51958:309-995(-)